MDIDRSSRKICEILGGLLREEREKADLSANKLAQMTGLNRQAITFVERGDRIPSIDTFTRIALALGKLPSDLWKEAESRAR